MARWIINKNDNHLHVDSVQELRQMARDGRITPADMIQAPGEVDWHYAAESPVLKDIMRNTLSDIDDDEFGMPKKGANKMVMGLLVAVIAVGGGMAAKFYGAMNAETPSLIDENGEAYSMLIVSAEGAALYPEAQQSTKPVMFVPKNDKLELLTKRGDFYKARHPGTGGEGWIQTSQVMPMYKLGGAEVAAKYDPLYNPDQYLRVGGASWMELAPAGNKGTEEEQTTVFEFSLANESPYDMTDVKLVATIKDKKGHEVETVEFPVEGIIPGKGATMVGTLTDPETQVTRLVTQTTFRKMASDQPDLKMEYTNGAEVRMNTADFTDAELHIVEVRALPKEG